MSKYLLRGWVGLLLAVWLAGAGGAQAQYTANNQTNLIQDGSVSNWSGIYYVGNSHYGDVLIVTNASTLSSSGGGYLGNLTADSNNMALVTGAGSVWTNKSTLYVGYNGAGNQIAIANGGIVYTPDAYLGENNSSASNNVGWVGGSGSVLSNAGAFYVGDVGGGNTLTITNGGVVNTRDSARLGSGYSDHNTALVTGAGSAWNNHDLYVGFYGNGNTLTIANSGTVVSAAAGTIGWAGSGNSVLVTGPGSVWSNGNTGLQISGGVGGNWLTVSNGGRVVVGTGGLGFGYYAGANNSAVLVTGTGSVLNVNGSINLNTCGNTLSIFNSGTVYNALCYLGYSQNSLTNSVVVSDPGSVWNNSGELRFTGQGNMLIVSNGGVAYNTTAYLGHSSVSSNNSVLVAGAGSIWNSSGALYVGDLGTSNRLTVANNGLVQNANGSIGDASGANNNAVTVTGSGSVWSNRLDLFVGNNGAGNTLRITNSGVVFAQNVTVGANASSSNNTVGVSGGSLVTTNAGAGMLDVRRGTFNLAGGTVLANKLLATNGSASVLQFNAGLLGVGQATVINGQAFEVGDGVQNAQLDLRGGTNNFAGGLNIASNSILTGTGSITNGSVLVRQGGVLSPGSGSGLGTLSIGKNLTVNGELVIKLNNLSGANGTNSSINVAGLLDLTGGMVTFEPQATLTNSVYVFGTYGTLLGTLSATNSLPSGYLFENNYSGNELALVAIPEPVAIGGLLLLGGALLTAHRLRRWRA